MNGTPGWDYLHLKTTRMIIEGRASKREGIAEDSNRTGNQDNFHPGACLFTRNSSSIDRFRATVTSSGYSDYVSIHRNRPIVRGQFPGSSSIVCFLLVGVVVTGTQLKHCRRIYNFPREELATLNSAGSVASQRNVH